MILLPRGNPVREKIDPGRVDLPEAFGRLRSGGFSGYMRFDTSQGTGVFVFLRGRLISAMLEGEGGRLTAWNAVARVFELSLAGGAHLGLYRLSPGLALSVHALLHGELRYKGQELKLIDVRALLGKLKEERLSGCLRIYTDDRIALIFYRDGTPLGFFHDGSPDIETTADASMSVARLPGAKIDVLSTPPSEDPEPADLMASSDIFQLWARSRESVARQKRSETEAAGRERELREQERRQRTLSMLRAAAEKHLGRVGVPMVEKEFDRAVAPKGLCDAALAGFYESIVRAARLVAGPTAVNAMLEEMKRGATSLLKSA